METAEQRAEYVERMLEALCSEPGPHPSGTRAYEQVALRIHADLESVLPDAFLDRYLDFWHVLPRPEIIYKGKQVAVDVAENCAGTSPEGFTGMIERIDFVWRWICCCLLASGANRVYSSFAGFRRIIRS